MALDSSRIFRAQAGLLTPKQAICPPAERSGEL